MSVQLLQGDCLELMKDIPDGSVDMVLCDLPYEVTANRWDRAIDIGLLWAEYSRVTKAHSPIILFGQGMFTANLMKSNPKMWRYNLIWEKTQPTGFLNANKMPLRSHEDILVFYEKLPVYHPQKTEGNPRKVSTAENKRNCTKTTNYRYHKLHSYDSTKRYPTSILKFKKDVQKSAFHPTQKPVALLEYLIRTYTNEGETVLDNCMGSGSAGVAAVNTGRNFIGMELDPGYFETARRRIEETQRAAAEGERGVI